MIFKVCSCKTTAASDGSGVCVSGEVVCVWGGILGVGDMEERMVKGNE